MSRIEFSALFLFFGILVLVTIARRVFSGGNRGACSRTRSVPGTWLRSAYALAGCGAFAAVGAATFMDVPWTESMEPVESPTVLVGDPMPAAELENWRPMKPVEEPGKLLIHVVAYRSIEDALFPAHAETFEFNWPEDKQKEESRVFTVDSTEFSINFRPNFLWWKRVSGAASPATTTLESQGHLGGMIRSGGWEAAFGSFLEEIDGKTSNAFAIGRPSSGWLSLVRKEAMHYSLSFSGEFVAKDAALTSIPVDEYLERFPVGRGPRQGSVGFHVPDFGRGSRSHRTNGSPGLALFVEKVPASWVLVAGVWLLSMAFRRRALAFAGWTLMAMLLCVTLDRATVSLDLARGWDVSAKPMLRAQACSHAASTFFYSETAKTGLMKIATSGVVAAEKSPRDAEPVRAAAERAASRL